MIRDLNYKSLLKQYFSISIVGGGTAGSVLASRISELSHIKVLLLEAGGEQTSKLRVPWFHLWLLSTPHSWNQVTDSQEWAMKGLESQVRN